MHSVASEVLQGFADGSERLAGKVGTCHNHGGLMVPGRTSERPNNVQSSVSRRHDDSGVHTIKMRLKFENILEIKPDEPGS